MPSAIDTAAKKCRAAFAKCPDATWAWCCHHEVLAEQLTEPAENRILFILQNKEPHERVMRLNNFRPVHDMKRFMPARAECYKVCEAARAEYDKVCAPAWAEYDKVCAAARAERYKVCEAARAEYDKVCAPAWAEYDKVCAAARAERYKVCAAAFRKHLRKLYKQDAPLGTWNGRSIFKT